jgi:glutathione S-transferase
MAGLKVYGIAQSRASRTLWCVRELGVAYDLVETDFKTDAKKPDYLKLNPNGRVPTIVDGDVVVFESLAINLYLAEKYGNKAGGLQPSTEAGRAHALQWTIWGLTEIDPHLTRIMRGKVQTQDDLPGAEAAIAALGRPLKVLDGVLAGKTYLEEERFTVADMNLAMTMTNLTRSGMDLSAYPNVKAWLDRCLARPARNG